MADKNWKTRDMPCGHLVDHSDSYVDDDNVIRLRYTCTEGCRTQWIKLMKVPLPDTIIMKEKVAMYLEKEGADLSAL